MVDAPRKPPDESAGKSREERLKAALRANIARRKAQARERAGVPAGGEPGQKTTEPGPESPDNTQ
ncbi:hypothetical protein [Halodurantibacterium flavum]|uniref:Uncharacterized protein n=1 Tax=Halodurantibacterium flavum TaxID=1382802 RepID=A0ABW4S1C9_9RHOB